MKAAISISAIWISCAAIVVADIVYLHGIGMGGVIFGAVLATLFVCVTQ